MLSSRKIERCAVDFGRARNPEHNEPEWLLPDKPLAEARLLADNRSLGAARQRLPARDPAPEAQVGGMVGASAAMRAI